MLITADEVNRRRNVADSLEIAMNSANQVLPRNMRAFLANPMNQDNMNNLIFSEWKRVKDNSSED